LLVGAAVIIVGVIIGQADDWSTGALWALGLAGALIAGLGYAIPAARRAPRLARHTANSSGGALGDPRATASRLDSDRPGSSVESGDAERHSALTVGLPIGPLHRDHAGLAPEHVLVLSGHASSGKSDIAEHLVKEHRGWARASCGDYVKEEARKRGVAATLPATNELGQQLVDELGGERFLGEVLAQANVPATATTLVLDDVYHVEVFDAIKQHWDHLKFVTVSLSDSMRRELWREQGRTDEEIKDLEHNPLDAAVTNLAAKREPEARIEGARNEQEILERTRQIDELVAV
jgi:hypothetical protein